VECVAAPSFGEGAVEGFASRKSVRLLRLGAQDVAFHGDEVRLVGPWALVQREAAAEAAEWKAVTRATPDAATLGAMRFAWEVVAGARSNAIAIVRDLRLVGLGSGQTSRVDAVDVALMKARRAGHDLQGTVLASDGFFPFADNVEHAAAAGVSAIVQPGGSVRDAEVVEACNRRGIAMVFTGRRVFRH
jgi:phosphoribosylaminoimidazolecarboxamide formyltransferase/IMP cyclohydrolase